MWFSGNKLYQTYYNNAKRLLMLIKITEMNLRNIKRQKRLQIQNIYIINQNKG